MLGSSQRHAVPGLPSREESETRLRRFGSPETPFLDEDRRFAWKAAIPSARGLSPLLGSRLQDRPTDDALHPGGSPRSRRALAVADAGGDRRAASTAGR